MNEKRFDAGGSEMPMGRNGQGHKGLSPGASASTSFERAWMDGVDRQLSNVAESLSSLAEAIAILAQQAKRSTDNQKEVETLVREALVPMSELNAKLRQRDVDEYILKPMVLALAHVIDRQNDEVQQEAQEMLFSFIENCRAMDREELLNLLGQYDFEPFGCRVGAKFDPHCHSIRKVRVTESPTKIGRIVALLRQGYKRRNDGWIVRPAWVEVWAPPPQSPSPSNHCPSSQH